MINLKQLLLKMLKKEALIGENSPDESLLNQMYPVGAEYITATNMNPGTWLGGTWELFDKEFEDKIFTHSSGVLSGITWNSTNVAANSSSTQRIIGVRRSGHTLKVYASWYAKTAMKDGEIQWFTMALSTFGINKGVFANHQGTINDTGAAIGMSNLSLFNAATSITYTTDDWVTRGTSLSTSTSYWLGTSFEILPDSLNDMLDSACNRFYWRRTA